MTQRWTELSIATPHGTIRAQTRGEGPLLVWTHGVFHPIDVDDHSAIGATLASLKGLRVVRYDTRGHGRTPPGATDDEHRWDRLAVELLALADALGAPRFIAGGISMGAAITLHAAVRAPERVAGMVLLAPPTGWDTRPTAVASYRALAALPDAEAVAAQVERDLQDDLGDGPIPPALRVMLDHLRRADPVALGRILRAAAASDLPPRDDVARVAVPTLVLPWENDPGHPLETAREIAATLPRARLTVIAGVDDTATMLGALRAFLSDVAAAT